MHAPPLFCTTSASRSPRSRASPAVPSPHRNPARSPLAGPRQSRRAQSNAGDTALARAWAAEGEGAVLRAYGQCEVRENEVMAMCKKCGAGKRRWPRSCSRCRSQSDRGDAAVDAAELAVEAGLLGWIARGGMGIVRLLLRLVG